MTATFEILHSLRVKGLARPEVLGALSGIPVEDLEETCRPLVSEGLVLHRTGAMGGYMLTPAGKTEADRLLAEDRATEVAKDDLARFDEAFLPHNTAFKQFCHRWQLKDDEQPNDHTDADYDAAVIADLAAFHAEFLPVLATISDSLPRFGRYADRFGVALARLRGGEQGAFARPMADSYHDIWMELHNDVVLSLRRERTAADEH